MKNISIFFIVGILLITVVLWSQVAFGATDTGEQLYITKCQLCHGVKGDGNGHASAFLKYKPADFTDPKFWEKEDEKKMAEVIENGRGVMPAFDLKPDKIKALIDYMTRKFKPQNK